MQPKLRPGTYRYDVKVKGRSELAKEKSIPDYDNAIRKDASIKSGFVCVLKTVLV